MTFEERKTIAAIFNILVKKIGINSTGSYYGSVTVKPVRGDRTLFSVRKLSWSTIDIYNETKRYRIASEKMEKSGDNINIVFETDERPGFRIYSTKLDSKSEEIRGEVERNGFEIKLDGPNRVLITDDERGGKRFEYNLE